ncbi:MAG TPA: signal peptide peptidase SppA [Bdellovibrionales bacterium]|nr:signal peptide peptidase SppA [Bdellovibrionales bacterium]
MGGLLFAGGACLTMFSPPKAHVSEASILYLKLDGIITESDKLLKQLKEYRRDENIKAVILHVNSPGGVVGPSQEIYEEIKRTREHWKKPVIVSAESLMASGAYYIAVGADKIVTNAGTLVGSIGVIMDFANLKELYQWAKIERYSIKTGPFKDTGAEYRAMSPEERAYLQKMLDEVHMQFKKAVAEGRNLPMEKVVEQSDGRIFTGEQAVAMGFADKVGTLGDAVRLAGEMTGLGEDPEVFQPPKERPGLFEIYESFSGEESIFKSTLNEALALKLNGQPLLLYPGARGLR